MCSIIVSSFHINNHATIYLFTKHGGWCCTQLSFRLPLYSSVTVLQMLIGFLIDNGPCMRLTETFILAIAGSPVTFFCRSLHNPFISHIQKFKTMFHLCKWNKTQMQSMIWSLLPVCTSIWIVVPLKDLACLMDNQTDKCLQCILAVVWQNWKRNPKCRHISL